MASNGETSQPLLTTANGARDMTTADPSRTDPIVTHGAHISLRKPFTGSAAVVMAVIVILFAVFVEYPAQAVSDAHVAQYYMWCVFYTRSDLAQP